MKQASSRYQRSVDTLGLSFTRPFSQYKINNFDFFATLFNQYDRFGNLPYEGPITDQPNKIIEVFNVIKALVQEQVDKENKKQKRR